MFHFPLLRLVKACKRLESKASDRVHGSVIRSRWKIIEMKRKLYVANQHT